jgi:acyl carrier protein
MEKFLQKLSDILEVELLSPTQDMKQLDLWDSLTVLSILAYIDEEFGVTVEAPELADVKTATELYSLVQSKL